MSPQPLQWHCGLLLFQRELPGSCIALQKKQLDAESRQNMSVTWFGQTVTRYIFQLRGWHYWLSVRYCKFHDKVRYFHRFHINRKSTRFSSQRRFDFSDSWKRNGTIRFDYWRHTTNDNVERYVVYAGIIPFLDLSFRPCKEWLYRHLGWKEIQSAEKGRYSPMRPW